MKETPGRLQLVLVDSHGRGGRRQVVKAAACGAAIRGFESPRSPSQQFNKALRSGSAPQRIGSVQGRPSVWRMRSTSSRA